MAYEHLFAPFSLGDLALSNRIVMAPMTRSRALQNVPTKVMAEYYAQRASAGLIITEGTAPSPNGLGYPRIPGLFSDAQVEGWRTVTEAVHAKGGRIFAQVMHVGRVGHPLNLPDGAELVAPSALAAPGEMYTDQEGPQPHPAPRSMKTDDIKAAIAEYVTAADNAIRAGFDGVELHGANGYLIDQFLNPGTNVREDEYGGSDQKRGRFAVEVAKAVSDAIGAQRVGIRLSPYGVFNGMAIWDTIDDAFEHYASELGKLNLVYLHLVDHAAMGAPEVPASIKTRMKAAFGGTVILSGGYDGKRAEADLAEARGELVAFGRPFLANPDLPARIRVDADLNEPKADLFYTPGPEGYTDYPSLG